MSSSNPSSSRNSSVIPSRGTEIVDVADVSDGDASHGPSNGNGYRLVDPPNIYLNKIADLWMQKMGIRQREGVKYYLRKLPNGYRLFQKARPNNPGHIDKFLYGHPEHKIFKSPNEFFPHFFHLMQNNGVNIGCNCQRCLEGSKSTGRAPQVHTSRKGHATATKQPVPLGASENDGSIDLMTPEPESPPHQKVGGNPLDSRPTGFVDEELTPDTIRNLLSRLKQLGILDTDIKEELSMDWIAAQGTMETWLNALKDKPSWLPRCGEIVLFVRDLPTGRSIEYDTVNNGFAVFDDEKNRFIGPPMWEAGVIAQTPEEEVDIRDLLRETTKKSTVTYSGFRVEPLPEPNQPDKSITKKHKYVPMHHIRPFSLYRELLPSDEHSWQPTIRNALTVMAAVSLVGRYYFRGAWPEATIFHKGIYIGSELIRVGDTVRLVPASNGATTAVTDVLEVRSIRLILTMHEPEVELLVEGEQYPCKSAIYLTGKAFTLDKNRAANLENLDLGRPVPEALAEYEDQLYWLHDSTKLYQVSFSSIQGRCYEASAMSVWLPQIAAAGDNTLAMHSAGRDGIARARSYAHAHDSRIPAGMNWLWSETRLEALDVRSLNGVDAVKHDSLREEMLEDGQHAALVFARPQAKMGFKGMAMPRPAIKHHGKGPAMHMPLTMSMAPHARSHLADEGEDDDDGDDAKSADPNGSDVEMGGTDEGGTEKVESDTPESLKSKTVMSEPQHDPLQEPEQSSTFASLKRTASKVDGTGIGAHSYVQDEDEAGSPDELSTADLLKSFGATQSKRPKVVVKVPPRTFT